MDCWILLLNLMPWRCWERPTTITTRAALFFQPSRSSQSVRTSSSPVRDSNWSMTMKGGHQAVTFLCSLLYPIICELLWLHGKDRGVVSCWVVHGLEFRVFLLLDRFATRGMRAQSTQLINSLLEGENRWIPLASFKIFLCAKWMQKTDRAERWHIFQRRLMCWRS